MEPTRSKYNVEQLIFDYTGIEVEIADASDILILTREMKKRMQEVNMEELYRKIEHPLIQVLADMELEGFKVDKQMLQELDIEFTDHVNRLTKEITDLAGETFNINSPKQLGEILFDKLGLPVQKKTKTGYSTDIEVLERLQGMHPIIDKIIDYRQVMKIKSTYIDGLLHVIHPSRGKSTLV